VDLRSRTCARWAAAAAFAFAGRSYQTRVAFTILTADGMSGASIRSPTTVARAAPDSKPKRLIAAAT
jgi:hypothetical protein